MRQHGAMTLTLRPYQELAIDAFVKSPWQRKMVVLSTGLGKTFLGLALARQLGGRMLWLAHREELINQPAKEMSLVWPGVSWGIVKAERNEFSAHVVFASMQSAQQPKRIEQLAAQGFDLVVLDECHHASSVGYKRIIDALGCHRDGGPQLLGLTATPERTDLKALDEIFQGVVFQMGITSAIEQGYLVPPTVISRPINIDLDEVSTVGGDYGQNELDRALMEAGIVDEVTSAYAEHCLGRKSLIFVISVAQAHAVAESLKAQGFAVEAISGETRPDERQSLLRRLNTGELSALVNVYVLTEGFNEPSVDCVILARPTQSKPLMIQKIGRALRLHPGKTDALVIDMVGVSRKHTLVQAAVLFGIKPDPNEKKKPKNPDPITDPEEYWIARLKNQIEGLGGAPRSKLHWLPTRDGQGWLLPAGEFGTVRMIPDGEDWRVDAVGARSGPQLQSLCGESVSLETAQAIAEDFCRRSNAVTLANKKAGWRDDGATEAQIEFLKKNGVDATRIGRGHASDMITQIMASKATELASSKQIYFLRRNGIHAPDGLTKREASIAIAKLRSGNA
jgi:ATP-dependent helicase IRC3